MDPQDWILQSPNGNLQELQDRHISEVEYNRLTNQFHNIGFREGIQKGKEISIQQGFDSGFEAGANRARRVGLLRGRASATLDLLIRQTQDDDARVDRLRQIIRELNQSGHFQDSTSTNDQDQIEGLANQLNQSIGLSSQNLASCHSTSSLSNDQKLHDFQSTLERCQFELNAILATMNILIQSP